MTSSDISPRGMTRRWFLKGAAAAAGAALGATSGCREGKPVAEGAPALRAGGAARKPNILLLMADQFRFDCMGCAGNAAVRTPNLDSIAHEGARFSAAYTSTPSCTPARAGLLTGMSPWSHGMLAYGRVAERYDVEMPRLLGDAGYWTFGVGKMHWFPQKTLHGFHGTLVDESGRVESKGFASDYRKWFMETAPGLDPDATGIGWNEWREGVYALPEELHPTRWTAETAIDILEKHDREEPFFLKVSFARPHSPYDPPARFLEAYREDDMPAPWVGDWAARHAPHPEPPPPAAWHGDLGVDQARRSRRAYYGSVSFIDEEIGRILDVLRRRGMLDETLVLFTSDHGDMLGDHHLWRKTYAYAGSAGVPMLLRWPKAFGHDERRGAEVGAPVELRDLLPTLLDAAGADVPTGVEGRSMLDLVRGEGKPWREWIDLEHGRCYHPTNQWTAVASAERKYVFHSHTGEEQLFDLRNDPRETRDLASDPARADELAEWRRIMAGHLSVRGEEWVSGGRPAVRRKAQVYSPNYPRA